MFTHVNHRAGPDCTRVWAALTLVGVLLTGACSREPLAELEVVGRRSARAPTWEEFKGSVYQEPWEGGVYILEGDLPVSDEAELRAYYDRHVNPTNLGALTVSTVVANGVEVDNLWGFPLRTQLTYCVGDFGDDQDTLRTALDAATESWEALVGVDFQEIAVQGGCNETTEETVFDVRPVATTQYFARAFFPDDIRRDRSLLVAGPAFRDGALGRDLEGILRHELGHAIGFRHEHIWLSNPCGTESSNQARQVTELDERSVMFYPQCRRPAGGGYRQTTLDYAGAIELYGLAPAAVLAALHAI